VATALLMHSNSTTTSSQRRVDVRLPNGLAVTEKFKQHWDVDQSRMAQGQPARLDFHAGAPPKCQRFLQFRGRLDEWSRQRYGQGFAANPIAGDAGLGPLRGEAV